MTKRIQSEARPLLEVTGLTKVFPLRQGLLGRSVGGVTAVKDVSFTVRRGEVLGLVGESGSGKTTIGRCILRLVEPTEGEILFDGVSVPGLSKSDLKQFRRRMQVVFQDPYSSLNPRMRIGPAIEEILATHDIVPAQGRKDRLRELFERVGLPADTANRFPHEFSGGQRQRVGIARALAFEPSVLILDEPVSALDVSVQAQILNLIIGLQEKLNLTYLFVSHDLAVVQHVADEVAVMYLGKIVESGSADDLFSNPAHPYTQALLSASPIPDVDLERKRKRIVLRGDISNSAGTHTGCQFANRCHVGVGKDLCTSESPNLKTLSFQHQVSCHYPVA